ncbi:MAG TPA: hypothetical protein P5531_05265 [Bacteroidales bacterium]|nr:hypothetical protein [Bacteroidales bacterium]HSA42815.1 hypothetical protein [Bacteroidales bacterium]
MTTTKTLKSVRLYRYDILENGLSDIEDWAPFIQSMTTYHEDGLVSREITYNAWGVQEQLVVYNYDEQRNLAEELFYDEGEEPMESRVYTRNELGLIISEHHRFMDESEDVVEYHYDEKNRLTGKVYYDSDGETERKEVLEYDGDLLLSEAVTDQDGNLISQATYSYDEHGKIEKSEQVRIEDGRSERMVSYFDENGNRKKNLRYNYQEQLIEISRFRTNGQGRLEEIEEENQHGKSFIKFTYDDQGNAVTQEEFNEKGDVISTIERKFDDEGRALETAVYIDGRNFRANQHYLLKYEYEFY